MDMAVQPPAGAMPVQTEIVQPRDFKSAITYSGSALAYNDIPIYPRVEGWLVSQPFYPGDRVRKGQVLAQLDSRELSSRVRESSLARMASLEGYRASLQTSQQAQNQMQKAQQSIQASKANLTYWQNEIQRAHTLVKQDVITKEEAQQEESQYASAQSQYNQALAEFRAAQSGRNASIYQSRSQQAQAGQMAAAAQTQAIIKSYTRLTAPQSGIVTARPVSPGTLVTPSMEILRITQIHPLRIQANVSEGDYHQLRIGSPVQIIRQGQSGDATTAKPINAKITALFPSADVKSRTAIVEALIPNTNEAFIPGDFVVMNIQTGNRPQVLTVSSQALIRSEAQQAVWVVMDTKAHLQFVSTGSTDGNRTEITAGLHAGDEVIMKGNRDLQEGMTIARGDYNAKPVVSNRLSAENHYQISHSIGHYSLAIKMAHQPPTTGTNQIRFTITPSMAGMSTQSVSVDTKTSMPAMASMPATSSSATRTGEGQYQADALYSMPGLWITTVIVKENGKSISSFPVEVEVSP
jgi:multidrug efflux pump subunit AcrA (membrane-fusion protein)